MKRSFIVWGSYLLLFVSCTGVSRVSTYSSSALKTIKKYDELTYTFNRACRDKCYIESVKKLSLTAEQCVCNGEETADSISSVLYKAIKGYYDGLVKLSANDLASYKTQPLTKELKTGTFGELKINKAEVDAYGKLSAMLLQVAMDGYRRKKLKKYVEAANEPIQILIRALESNIVANLTGRLNVHKARMQSIYFDFLEDSTASNFEKKKVIDEFNFQMDDIEVMHKQLSTFSKGLRHMHAGHQKLYDNRHKLNAREVKEMLVKYASDLEDILSDFNKLKSK